MGRLIQIYYAVTYGSSDSLSVFQIFSQRRLLKNKIHLFCGLRSRIST